MADTTQKPFATAGKHCVGAPDIRAQQASSSTPEVLKGLFPASCGGGSLITPRCLLHPGLSQQLPQDFALLSYGTP